MYMWSGINKVKLMDVQQRRHVDHPQTSSPAPPRVNLGALDLWQAGTWQKYTVIVGASQRCVEFDDC